MSLKGYDIFYPETGKVNKIKCKVCGENCFVLYNVVGATSSADAMAGIVRSHDCFSCLNNEEDWHKQALDLLLEIERNPSLRLKEIMKDELDELIQNNIK